MCWSGQSPNGNAGDSVVNTASHEQNESITDPLGTGWYDSAGHEIGDKCHLVFGPALSSTSTGKYNEKINGHGYWLQEVWSNRAHACVQRNTFPQPTASFAFSPTSPVHGKKVTFSSQRLRARREHLHLPLDVPRRQRLVGEEPDPQVRQARVRRHRDAHRLRRPRRPDPGRQGDHGHLSPSLDPLAHRGREWSPWRSARGPGTRRSARQLIVVGDTREITNGSVGGWTAPCPMTILLGGAVTPVGLERNVDRRRAARVEVETVDVPVVLEQERDRVLVTRELELVALLEMHRRHVGERAARRELAAERTQIRVVVRDPDVPAVAVVPHVGGGGRERVDARGPALHDCRASGRR